ncbi:MAG TPA: glycosyltransferase family 2 protein [Candidatus Nanoarchaeia archaeon]|nr:glycosyltransferase family 2 protein [Candidatus Nanoarchaeia archaeon]
MMRTVSVVVCTRNRSAYLQRCISSLLTQSIKPKEIIIVDDASDETNDAIQMLNTVFSSIHNKVSNLLSENIEIKYIRNKHRQGVVRSRNIGIMVAKGSIVAFIDDDGYAHRDWIRNLRRCYQKKNIVSVGGPVVEVGRHIETRPRFKRLSYVTQYGDIKHNYRVKKFMDTKSLRSGTVKFLMGGNMSFRRNILLKLYGFNSQYKGNYYREETDMCMRVSKIGKIVFEPSAVAYHNTAKYGGTRDIMHLENFLYWYFRNTILLFFRHFDLKNATTKTWRQCSKYFSGVRNGTIKVNRDYLLVSASSKILLAILTGTIMGIFIGLIFDKPLKKLVYKHPEYATLITIALMGTTFQVVDYRNVENVIRHLDKF